MWWGQWPTRPTAGSIGLLPAAPALAAEGSRFGRSRPERERFIPEGFGKALEMSLKEAVNSVTVTSGYWCSCSCSVLQVPH